MITGDDGSHNSSPYNNNKPSCFCDNCKEDAWSLRLIEICTHDFDFPVKELEVCNRCYKLLKEQV